MSVYDTVRCIWHDPAFLVHEHADTITAIVVVAGVLFVWGLA